MVKELKIEIVGLEELASGLKRINCQHCFCITTSVKVGTETKDIIPGSAVAIIRDIHKKHFKCCNCGLKKFVE